MSGFDGPKSIFTAASNETNLSSANLLRLNLKSPHRLSTPEHKKSNKAGSGREAPLYPHFSPRSRLWNVELASLSDTTSSKANGRSPASQEPVSGSVSRRSPHRHPGSHKRSHSQILSPSQQYPESLNPAVNKRRRLHSTRRHTLGPIDFPNGPSYPHSSVYNDQSDTPPLYIPDLPKGPSSLSENQQTSPLFFSNSRKARPPLPPRFSSGEAGARMLSKARAEESSIKTVTLARGSYSGVSPPAGFAGIINTPSFSLSERGSVPGNASPEIQDTSRILSQIGVLELLEQDSRPTFVVDLDNTANYAAGPLRIIFANAALRLSPVLLELVQGKRGSSSPRQEPMKGFPQFKAWLLSPTANGESLDVSLSAFIHGGLSWSCSTLRKRLRVVSASGAISQSSDRSSDIPSTTSLPLSLSAPSSSTASSLHPVAEEPQDYFGNAVPTPLPEVAPTDGPADGPVERPSSIQPTPEAFKGIRDRLLNNDLSSLDTHSFQNECVLGAAAAGAVDPFFSPPKEIGFFDWTRLPLSDDLPRHIQFARSVDWASTALGPIDFWSSDLRQMCNLIMASPHPAAMYWGDDLVAIYNEAYVLLAGQKHPRLMGQRYREAWAEIWDDVKEVFTNARLTGQATMKDDDCLFMKRSNYLEETYFSWSIIPMVGSDGTVTGLYNPAFEKTRRKIAERRMLTLREVGERTATARDVKSFWRRVEEALGYNECDTPFVLLYSVSDESDSDSNSATDGSLAGTGTKMCILEGSLGVPEGHGAAPQVVDLRVGIEGFAPFFRDAMKTDKPVLLKVVGTPEEGSGSNGFGHDGLGYGPTLVAGQDSQAAEFHTSSNPDLQLHASMLEGIEWRGFRDPCTSVVVCPVHPTTGESILGFLVLGVNPRRPYDDDYSLFVQLLSRQLATSLASVVLFEEEIRRGQKAAKLAALDRIELSQQLAARTQEARDIESRFTRMAEFSPTGLFIADSRGHITYCNDTWYEITRVRKDAVSTDHWIDSVKEDDQATVRQLWENLISRCIPVRAAEFRFKASWEDQNGNKSDTWVLFSAYPERYTSPTTTLDHSNPSGILQHAEGSLKSVFGSMTNISEQKWAEGFQRRKMEEAIELKRQQENFIDITSHEMRNPLSAILQCADEITGILSDYRIDISTTDADDAESPTISINADIINSSVDAAQTIALCAQHQKRIVDDVLTLSKLDSQMLMVTPVDVQPLTIVQRSLKMFENEITNADIGMNFVIDDSFKRLGIDWVKLDPQRVLQVLINLMTNAIKFTTSESKRTITVTVAASLQRPSSIDDTRKVVDFFPTRRREDGLMAATADWGSGEELYILFAVQDTGRGLTADEKKLLFMRFSQASPRTHVQYGGSGLGLFISRELTELQGGEIGVASEAGKGSTFAFYIKARRSSTPSDPGLQFPALLKQVSDAKSKRQESLKTKEATAAAANHNPQAVLAAKKAQNDISLLIVEDNLVNQRVLQKQLKHLGFTVYVANHGGECLDQLRRSQFWHENKPDSQQVLIIDVILMDQEMPVMDGLAATKEIRTWEKQGKLIRHVPIIAVTANARVEQIQALLGAGMDECLSKPFRIPDLTPKIDELIARYPRSPSAEQKRAQIELQESGEQTNARALNTAMTATSGGRIADFKRPR